MKVLNVVTSLGTNGVAKAVSNLTMELIEAGHCAEVLILENSGVVQSGDFVIHQMPTNFLPSRHHKVSRLLRRLFRTFLGGLIFYELAARMHSQKLNTFADLHGYDCILLHCHYSKILMQWSIKKTFFIAHNKKSKQLVGDWWGATAINRRVIRRALKSKNIVAVSEEIKSDLVTQFFIEDNQVYVIPNIYRFAEINLKARLFEPELPEQYYIAVGRLTPQKNYNWLVDVYATSQQLLPLYIVGDGPLYSSLKAQIKRMGLENKVFLLGALENPYPLIKRAKSLIISSQYEGLSTVLIEALFLRTRIVATRSSLTFEIMSIAPEGWGDVVDDECEMKQALDVGFSMVSIVPPKVSDWVSEYFSAERVVSQYLNVIRQ